jgi:hypothetical protein
MVSLPFLTSRAKGQVRHRLVTAGPSPHSKRPGPGLVAARQLARSAVRVPVSLHADEPRASTTLPHLFVHEGARQQLEKSLRRVLGKRIVLAITDNRRTMVSAHDEGDSVWVGIHHMFLDADPFTQRALGRYLRDADRAASTTVGAYIEANQQRIRPPKRRSGAKLITAGEKHDLKAIFNRLNDTYFQGMVDAQVGWGRRTQPRDRTQRKSIKLGTYCADRKLIRIHPTLDRSWVPRYFVEYVVFHEMLHHMLPMPVRGGRRELHTPEFRESESRFRHYARALEWEQRNIGRLLRR